MNLFSLLLTLSSGCCHQKTHEARHLLVCVVFYYLCVVGWKTCWVIVFPILVEKFSSWNIFLHLFVTLHHFSEKRFFFSPLTSFFLHIFLKSACYQMDLEICYQKFQIILELWVLSPYYLDHSSFQCAVVDVAGILSPYFILKEVEELLRSKFQITQ